MGLAQILYISDAVGNIGKIGLASIQQVAVRNNAALHITGVLFYARGHFVQLLEGDREDICPMFETIVRDPRHENIKLLYKRDAKQRIFCDWDMAVLDLDSHSEEQRLDLDDLVQLAGYHVNDPDADPPDLTILKKFRTLLTS